MFCYRCASADSKGVRGCFESRGEAPGRKGTAGLGADCHKEVYHTDNLFVKEIRRLARKRWAGREVKEEAIGSA